MTKTLHRSSVQARKCKFIQPIRLTCRKFLLIYVIISVKQQLQDNFDFAKLFIVISFFVAIFF